MNINIRSRKVVLYMNKKHIFIGIFTLFVLLIMYFGNIIFAFVSHSEYIDKHMFNVMLQGKFNSSKELIISINNTQHHIPLPNGSGELNKDEYLVPVSSWNSYENNLRKTEWNYFDQIGTLVRVINKSGNEFNISNRPFTGAYRILKYSSINKQ